MDPGEPMSLRTIFASGGYYRGGERDEGLYMFSTSITYSRNKQASNHLYGRHFTLFVLTASLHNANMTGADENKRMLSKPQCIG